MGLLNKITTAMRNAFGKDESVEPLQSDEARVMGVGRILDDHPSRRIRPQKVQAIFDRAEDGDVREQAQLFMDIEEQSASIASLLSTRKRATLTLDWAIVAPKDASKSEEEMTQAVKEMFAQVDYLDDLIVDLMDACLQGFSASEIKWLFRDGKWYPSKFFHRPASWFRLDQHDNPLLISDANPMGEPLIPQKWIVHTHKNRSSALARNGLGRTLAWIYMFEHYAITDFAEFLELYGFPIRIGKYGAGATADEKRSLLRALSDIGHNAAGIMPDTMQVELHEVAKSGASGTSGTNPYLQMTDWAEQKAAKMILGQTLTSGADGKSSTNALGKVHNEVRKDLLASDAKQLEQTINQQLIMPFLLINFPNIDPSRVPVFAFDLQEYEDMKTFAEALPNLVNHGMRISVAWAHEKTGIPMAAEDEEILKPLQNGFKVVENGEESAKNTGKKTALSEGWNGCPCGCGGKLHALSTGQKTGIKEQDELDDALANAFGEVDFNKQLDPITRVLTGKLMACNSYEEAFVALSASYPTLSSEEHERYLTNALFLADLLGANNAERT